MSFESIPFAINDVVLVPGYTQGEGTITRIAYRGSEEEPQCVIEVTMVNPLNIVEYCFNDGDDMNMYFTKKDE
jgi:hypothetical protein